MALKVLHVTVYFELVSKYYGTVCVKVQTVLPTETMAPVSTWNYWPLDNAQRQNYKMQAFLYGIM